MSEAFELIKQRFELNENYHNAKESMAWLASTIYYGSCLSIISILLINDKRIWLEHLIILLLLSVTKYIGAMCFTNLQFRMRWQSNDTNSALGKIFDNYNPKYTVQNYMSDLAKYKKECSRRRCKGQVLTTTIFFPFMFWTIFKMDSEYHTEIPSYGIAFYLFLIEAAIIIVKYVN